MTYSEKLKDPRWQKRRLELLDGSNWTCGWCSTKSKTLHVHHGFYRRGVDPWDYEDKVMHVLCDECHKMAETGRDKLYEFLGKLLPRSVAIFGQMVAEIQSIDAANSAFLEVIGSLMLDGEAVGDPPPVDRFGICEWIQRRCLSHIYEFGIKRGFELAEEMEEKSQQKAAS
jgi:hypothetical protein